MPNILILGANGNLARVCTAYFLDHSDAKLSLYLRNAERLQNPNPERCQVIDGDVLNQVQLEQAMQGQDIVLASLSGDLLTQAKSIIQAMHATNIKRLIFISSMGIYDEVIGANYGAILDPYRESAAEIEASDLDYTLIRPAWFTNEEDVNYQITRRNDTFKGMNVSMKSLADLILNLSLKPHTELRESLGVSKPL